MHRTTVGIITAALLAVAACSSDGTGSISSPSPLPSTATSPAKPEGPCSQGNCVFEFTAYPDVPSRWHGETEPTAVPALGHPGHLTVNFPKTFFWGATLRWDKFHHGAQAVCEITNNVDLTWKYVVPDHCGDGAGTLLVYPTRTTEYTFTDKENPEQSRDEWQVAKVTVTMPAETADVTATWEPRPGFNLEDPVQLYSGTVVGPLDALVARLMQPGHAHCGLGGGGEYAILTARMALNSSQEFVGTYDGNPGCMAARGTFTLTREQ